MTVRWGGLLLLNSPNIGWGIRIPRQQVGKAINLNRMTERNYLCEVRQRLCHGVVARPNPKRPSRALTNGF
jgi:hypothetical protein